MGARKKYSNLQSVVFLMVISAVFRFFVGTMFSINNSRAWLDYSWICIPIVIILQAFLLFFLNVSTIEGIVWFGIFSEIPYFLVNVFLTYRGFRAMS